MVQVRFINDTTPIDVTSETQETKISVKSENQVKNIRVKSQGTDKHNELYNRDLPDQHPISAITGLQEALVEVSDKTFVFEQGTASQVWEIEHNLDKQASATFVDSSGSVQIPDDVTYNSKNKITATFLAPFAGKAFLN